MRLRSRGTVAGLLLLLLVLAVPLLAAGCGPLSPDGHGLPDSDPGDADDDSSPALDAAPVTLPGMFRSLGRLAFVRNDILYVLDGDTGQVHRLTPPGQRALGPRWSNQGTWLAFTSADGSLILEWYDGSRRHTVTELPGPAAPGLYAWSPAADLLAVAPEGSGIWLVRPGYPPYLLLQPDGPVRDLAWSPDGSTLAYVVGPRGAGDETLLFTVRLGPETAGDSPTPAGRVDGMPVVRHSSGAGDLRLAGWWPDGNGLLLYRSDGAGNGRQDGWQLQSLPLGGEVRELVPVPAPSREGISWFPGEMRLLTATRAGSPAEQAPSLAACHVVTGRCRPYPSSGGGDDEGPWSGALAAGQVAPTGDRIAIVTGPGHTGLWIAGADDRGADARPLATGGAGPLSVPHWSADGRHLLYVQDNTLWLHPVDGQAEPHPLVSPWQLPGQNSQGAGEPGDEAAGSGDGEAWTRLLAWHRPVLSLPGEDRSGRVGPIFVLPFAERGPDGIVSVSGKVSVAVAAEGARRVQFFAAPRDEEGPGVLIGEAAKPVEGRFIADWEPPMSGAIFKLTAVVHGEGETRRRTLLVRGSPEPVPDRFEEVFTPLASGLEVRRLEGLPREFAAQGWLGPQQILGSVGPFLVRHQIGEGKTSALGVTGLEAAPGPGNGLVAYLGQDQGVYAIDVDGGARQLLWSVEAGGRHHFVEYLKPLWSPRGNNLLVPVLAQGEPEYYVVRLSPPSVERLSPFRDGYFTTEAVGWAGPGQIVFNGVPTDRLSQVALGDRGTHIFIYHTSGDRFEPLAGGSGREALSALAAGPGGIVFRRDSGSETAYGLMNHQGRVVWEESLGQVLAASPSPDGKAVAYIKEAGLEGDGIRLVLAVHRDGREVELAEMLTAEEVTGPFWSADGQRLLISFNTWVAGGQEEGPLGGTLAYYTLIVSGAPVAGSP